MMSGKHALAWFRVRSLSGVTRKYETYNSILELKEIRYPPPKKNNTRDLNPTQQVSSSCSGHGGHVTHAGSSALEGASPAW